jgi:single-strand DNA-binding protein
MIKLQVIGHLGKDCLTNIVNGKNVINFNVAHTEKYKDQQGNAMEKTTWVECNYWTDKTAIAPYLRKGTQVYVEGTPEVHQYTKNDGSAGVSLKCRVFTVQLLGSSNKEDRQAPNGQAAAADAPENGGGYKPLETPASTNAGAPVADGDLPF